MKPINLLLLAAVLSGPAVSPVLAQFTTGADVVTGSTLGDPLAFLYSTAPASVENRAPVGTALWFVSDSGAAGVPTGQVSKETIDVIAAGTGDDKLFATASVDGLDTLVNAPGRFQQSNLSYPLSEQNKPVYVYLWSDSHGGDVGDTFGLLELTLANGRIVPPVGLANFEFHVNSEIFADTFTVVPEPAGCAAAFGIICAGAALWRARGGRRRQTAH